MDKYKIINQGAFERGSKFEERINTLAYEGWKAISISAKGMRSVVLLERG